MAGRAHSISLRARWSTARGRVVALRTKNASFLGYRDEVPEERSAFNAVRLIMGERD